MVITTTVAAFLVLWKIITEPATVWDEMSDWVSLRVEARMKRPNVATQRKEVRRNIERITQIVLHSLAVSSLLTCLGIELYHFGQILESPDGDQTTWVFGQIVGITIWFRFIVELAYLQYSEQKHSLVTL
jgi:hypothetical protein